MDQTKIYPCSCKSEYQDKKYGKGNRVMNSAPRAKGDGTAYRCTVCSVVH